MRAVLVERFGGPGNLRVAEVDTPELGDHQVRVAVAAAAVNPVDVATRAGVLSRAGLHDRLPVRLGWDVYGRVEAVGSGVRRLREGLAVIGLSDQLSAPSKAQADWVVLDEGAVAAVPAELDAAVGSCLPLAGSTALQALDRLDLRAGQTVLITGAGGAVGALGVQLAAIQGLRVVAAGRPADEDLARRYGAEWFIQARPDLADRVRQSVPDGAVDAAGMGAVSLDAVRGRGAHVSLSVVDRPAPLRTVRSESLAVVADWKQLTMLASLAATAALTVTVAGEYSLDEVAVAHERLATGGVRGRLVLRP